MWIKTSLIKRNKWIPAHTIVNIFTIIFQEQLDVISRIKLKQTFFVCFLSLSTIPRWTISNNELRNGISFRLKYSVSLNYILWKYNNIEDSMYLYAIVYHRDALNSMFCCNKIIRTLIRSTHIDYVFFNKNEVTISLLIYNYTLGSQHDLIR
jgi:hypothetical protein